MPTTPKLVIAGSALAELGRKAAHDCRYDGNLGPVSLPGDADAAILAAAAAGVGVIVDAISFMPKITAMIGSQSLVAEGSLGRKLERLRPSRTVPAP